MTAKEKAKELIDKFTFQCKECDYNWNAKQCALIAIDEILKANNNDYINYWNEVKQEIEKL